MATGGSINTDILSDETFDLLCTICKRKRRNREAEKYCIECNDYYCLTCVKVHEDVPLLSGHKILDQGQFKSSQKMPSAGQGSLKTLPKAPTERCDRHNHYYIDMYCQNHNDVGCATCMAVDHRSCKDTFYIPEFLQNNPNTHSSKETKQILQEVTKILTKYHDDLQHQKKKLLKAKAESLENIRKFRNEINDRLDKLEQNSVDEIESLYKALINKLEKATKVVQTKKTNVKSAYDKLASSGSNASQAFVNVKKGNQIANMASKCIEDNKTQIEIVDIEFVADQKLAALVEEMNALGMITQRNIKNEENIAYSISSAQYQQSTSSQTTRQKKYLTTGNVQQSNVLLQATRKTLLSVKVKSDKNDCCIVSACTMEDGTIILSDYFNNKLKRLDSSTYTVTDHCDLPGKPRQVCPISKQEVAVYLSSQNAVQFISVGSRMTITKQIKIDFPCCGLAYAAGNLYISDITSVHIYSVSGSELKQYSKDQTGKRLFSDIISLAVSKDGSKIYVSELNKGLTVLDNNGQVVGQFSGPQLEGANGCYLTDTGSLLVCVFNSKNVLQFGPDGKLIGEVVKSSEKNYRAVCCNQQMSKMILSSESNDIEVYDLV